MTILSQKQLSLAEIYSDCTHFFESDKHHFLSLLEENLNLHALIPHSFYQHYYRNSFIMAVPTFVVMRVESRLKQRSYRLSYAVSKSLELTP